MSEHDKWLVQYEADRARDAAIRAEARRRGDMTPAQRAYEDEFGREALDAQIAALGAVFPCCGEQRSAGHHEACSQRPADVPPVIEGQSSLV